MRLFSWRAAALLALGSLSPLTSDAGTLRCGQDLVSEGEPSATLLLRCGQPWLREDLVRLEETPYGQRSQILVGERWTYRFGKHQFVQFVTIKGGVIREIEDGPRE
ncbi:MAG: DUF2845 domain-containing protein [Aeromonas sp.]